MNRPALGSFMTDLQFEQLRTVIRQRSGIHFPVERKALLESRLARRLQELALDDFGGYLAVLTDGPDATHEFHEMLNRITVNETSFFRNEAQLAALEHDILPRLLEARRDCRRLRLWSAACSSGQEPYTLAIQLHRTLGVQLADWSIDILGTDISQKMLRLAEAASYDAYSLRNASDDTVQRYFTQRDGVYRLSPEITSMARFAWHSLDDAAAAATFGTFDLVVCRNVLIYFDQGMREQCAAMFADRLADDGVLLIGHSESLRELNTPFEPDETPCACAYRKRGEQC